MRIIQYKKHSLLSITLFFLLISAIFSRPNWQQHVDYWIDVTLIDSLRTFKGDAVITYANNSPDTLSSIWFRLPIEARNPTSEVDHTYYRGRKERLKSIPEKDWGRLRVTNCQGDLQHSAQFLQDGSIGRVILDPALPPGGDVTFTLAFETKFPSGGAISRCGYQNGQYRGAYWYPMVCPYTPEYGWTVNRYFGTAEAYGEFGNFTVRYTVPYKYIVASTGYLVNEDEVLPLERFAGLNVQNKTYLPIPAGEEGERSVTWIYHAENVPDVAFAADPQFVIDRKDYGNFQAWAFIRRGREEAWADAAELIGWTIQELEKIYGEYPWTRVYATDSWSAMEYPMLTHIGWKTPQYQYVMIHEVVHNYTPMILHSNSVDAQVLDEGFTTFIEHELITRRIGSVINREDEIDRGLFTKTIWVRDDVKRGRRPYLEATLDGEDLPMVRGADVADEYWLLRVSTYYKTPVLLNALSSVIGEEAFWRGFRLYYQNHRLSHVDEQDVIESFEEASGRALGWFFKQFLYDNGDIDYCIRNFRVQDDGDSLIVRSRITRLGEVRLPIRLGIIFQNGDTLKAEIPFLPTDPSLPGFITVSTWDQLHDPQDFHEVALKLPVDKLPIQILLDPEERYTDRNPLDNQTPFNKIEYRFDPLLLPIPEPPVDRYRIRLSGLMGYNAHDGMMPGVSFQGDYMERLACFKTDILTPTKSSDHSPQFRFAFTHPIARGFHPFKAVFDIGKMHADRWAQFGLNRTWRTWRPHYYELSSSLQFGVWEQFAKKSPIAIGKTQSSSFQSIPYLWCNFKISAPRSPRRWNQGFNFYQGLGDHTFAALESSGLVRLGYFWGWQIRLENRFAFNSDATPAQFHSELTRSSQIDLRGIPLFGGRWTGSGEREFPRPYALASLTSAPVDEPVKRFAVHTFLVNRGLPDWMQRMGWQPAQRFLQAFRFGIFQSSALYQTHRTGIIHEIGPRLSFGELYGLTLHLTCAPWRASGGEGRHVSWFTPQGWRWKDWDRHVALWISLNLEKPTR